MATHFWIPRSLLVIRVRESDAHGREKCDLHSMSGHAPPARARATVAEETERDRPWKMFENTITQILRRCVLVSGLDANCKMGQALHWVGTKRDKAKNQRNSDVCNDAGAENKACVLQISVRQAQTHELGATQQGQETESTTSWSELPGRFEALRSCMVRGWVTNPCGATWALHYCSEQSTWSSPHLTEACKASPRKIEGLVRRELCHRSAFGSDGMVRSTSAAERPRGIRNLESHQVKCLCDEGLMTNQKRQAKGNIKHALTAETPQLVREKQIFLYKLPSDRPLTDKKKE